MRTSTQVCAGCLACPDLSLPQFPAVNRDRCPQQLLQDTPTGRVGFEMAIVLVCERAQLVKAPKQ